jgi:hypothetical protein
MMRRHPRGARSTLLHKPREFLKLNPLIRGRTDRNIKVDILLDHTHGERLHLIVAHDRRTKLLAG